MQRCCQELWLLHHLRAHIIAKLGEFPSSEINTKLVQSFVTSLATSGRRSRKTIENVLLILSSLLKTAKAWDYACGSFPLSGLTLPRNGVKKEQRCFTAEETGRIIFAASEPLATIWALTATLGLRVGEVLALRASDLDFERKLIRVRQSLNSATRKVQACKSHASSADVPMSPQLETQLLRHIAIRQSAADLLFVNKHGRPYSANKLREKHSTLTTAK